LNALKILGQRSGSYCVDLSRLMKAIMRFGLGNLVWLNRLGRIPGLKYCRYLSLFTWQRG